MQKNRLVFLRHTESGVQVSTARLAESRTINKDPNAKVIVHSVDAEGARAACQIAVETLRFVNQLREI